MKLLLKDFQPEPESEEEEEEAAVETGGPATSAYGDLEMPTAFFNSSLNNVPNAEEAASQNMVLKTEPMDVETDSQAR